MRQNILFLSEKDFVTLPIIRSLDRGAYQVFVAGPRESSVRFSRFCDYYLFYPQCFTGDKSDILIEYINKISKEWAIKSIIPLDLDSTLWMSKNGNKLTTPTLPLNNTDVILQLHNKWELTKVLDELSIAYPKTVLIENQKGLVDGVTKYPFLIKPLDKDGGQGIFKIDNPEDLKKYREAQPGDGEFPIIGQQYIEGFDIDMSLLAIDGKILSWTIQKWNQPGVLEFVTNQEVYNVCERIVTQKKYSGFAHIDLRIENKTKLLFFIEFNPRTWGSISASILAGVDFISNAVHSTLNEPVLNQVVSKESYVLFPRLLKIIFTRPWRFLSMSSISKMDFVAVLSDPIPYIILAWRIWRKE